ncbi:MAG TPA: hypothetical protein VES89_05030 [Candidatus Competibacteraceae bacterium]|nr:hypothetical protein [Candidatus Competibacteraceae bacterium]
MFRFLQSLFTTASSQAGKFDKELMLRAIERVVDGTDPRLRAVSHYRRQLWDAVEHALDYVVTFVNTLPPASAVDRRAYITDPRLRALFVSPDHLQEILSFSDGMRNYLKQANRPLPAELYAALGVTRLEKTVLGIELDGDMLQREVPQTVVNFSGHRLVFLHDNEPDTRRELMKRGFDYLIEVALQGLAATRLQKQQLEQQQHQLLFQKKARLLKAAQPGLEALLEPATPEPTDVDVIEQQLQEVEAELDQLRADSGTLEQHLEKVAATLGKPEDFLQLEPISLTLDHINIKVPPNSGRVANNLTFEEMVLAEDRRVIALFIRFPSDEILPPPDVFAEARRFL